MKNVWVVTLGDYSDKHIKHIKHIVGICSTEARALLLVSAIIASGNGNSYAEPIVEQWDVDRGIEAIRQHLVRHDVIMDRAGDVVNAAVTESWGVPLRYEELTTQYTISRVGGHRRDDPRFLIATVWARDVQHAVKITGELRTQILAREEWPT